MNVTIDIKYSDRQRMSLCPTEFERSVRKSVSRIFLKLRAYSTFCRKVIPKGFLTTKIMNCDQIGLDEVLQILQYFVSYS